jgi:hypothetical protein
MPVKLDIEQLPGSLGDVVDAIGVDAALRLVECLGGTRLYVPERMTPEHPIVALLGHKNAYALANQFGGDQIILPRCVAAMRAIRDATIRELRSGGVSTKRLALNHGLTERQIYAILAGGSEEESPQQSLL